MTVRPATSADAAALAELAAATFSLACPPSTTEAAKADFIGTVLSEAAFSRYLADPGRALLVDDEARGPLVGYTMLVLGEPADADAAASVRVRPTSELSKIYVLPSGHGRGIAAELLVRTLAVAADRGAHGVWLGTNEANARAIRFYAKHGFATVGYRRFRLGGVDEHDVVLERALT